MIGDGGRLHPRRGALPSYLAATSADTAADAMVYAALGWVAAARWGPGGAGLVLAANTVPLVLVMVIGGAIADRIGLARQAVMTLGVRVGLMCLLAAVVFVPKGVGWWVLLALSALLGLVDAFHLPALSGVAGLIATEGEQVKVQGLVTAVTRTALVTGTLAAGVLIGFAPQWAFWAAALLSLLALVLLVASSRHVPKGGGEGEGEAGVLADALAGLRAIRGRPNVLSGLVLLAVVNCVATAPIGIGLPSRAAELDWSGAEYGVAYLGFGVGAALGGVGIAKARSRAIHNGRRLAVLLLLPSAVIYAGLAVSTDPYVAATWCGLAGLCMGPIGALIIGDIREQTPSDQMGRISSLIQLGIFSAIPIGHVVYGGVGAFVSVTTAGLGSAALLLLSGLTALVMLPSAGRVTAPN